MPEATLQKKTNKHADLCAELHAIYKRKNSDYGDAFSKSFKEYGMVMPCLRLEDKLNRLKALTVHKKRQQVSNESIEDTLLDLANYAIMTVVELTLSKQEEK